MIIIAILICVVNTILWGAIITGEGNYTIFKKKLTWEETYIGAGVGIAAGLVIWWPLCLILALICGLLWAWAGAEGTSKAWRRWLIPAIIGVLGLFKTWWAPLTGVLIGFPIAMGYGIPSGDDKGSTIGRFFFNITGYKPYLADVLTRGTIGLLIGIALIPLVIGR